MRSKPKKTPLRDASEGGTVSEVRHNSAWVSISILLVFLLTAGVRIYHLTRDPLWYDEVMYTILCRTFSLDVATARTVRIEPLFYLFLWAWEKLGQGDFWIRFHSVLAGVATVALAFRAGRHLNGNRGAFIFSVLTAVAPFLVFYSRDAKMYSWLAFLELAVAWFALRYSEPAGTRTHLALYTICAIALVHTHILSGIFLAVFNLTIVLVALRGWRKFALWLFIQCVIVLASIPYLWMQLRLADQMKNVVFWVPPPNIRSIWVTCANFFSGYAPGSWLRMFLLVLMGVMAVVGLFLCKGRRRWVLLAVMAGALNVLAFYVVSRFSRWSFYVDRYMIGTVPLWLMAASVGIASLSPALVRYAVLVSAVGLSAVGLGGLYRGVLSPDTRDHLGVIRSVDTRSMAVTVRDYRDKHSASPQAVWHVSWETFLTAKWYLPELRHMAVEMDGEMNMAMTFDEIACRRQYYDAYAVPLEEAAAGWKDIWLVVPESEPPVYPRFRGFQAWLEARGECLHRDTYGGHMAPSGLYLYDMSSKTRPARKTLDLPLISTTETARLQASLTDVPQSATGPSILQIHGTGTMPTVVRCTALSGDLTLSAADFDRHLGAKSRWVLQLYSAGQWPRIAFRNTLNQGSPQGDALVQQVRLVPGTYDVLVERLAGGQGPLEAPLALAIGGKLLMVGSGTVRGPADWQWVNAGIFTSTGDEASLAVSAANPAKKPEVIPVFSEIVFVRREPSAPPLQTPVVADKTEPLVSAPVEVSCPPVPEGRVIEWVVATQEQCGRLTESRRSATLQGTPAP